MKKQITLFITGALFCSATALAQTNTFPTTGSAGIGTITPAGSAILDMTSTTQGMLAPRMTKAQRNAIVSPATGLLIYQTNSQPGFYFYNGSEWTPMSGKGASKALSNLSATTAINSALLPNADNTLDLGSSTLHWNEAYVNSIKFMDGTTQSTASAGGAGYSAGTGISITGSVISNTGDTNAADDVTTSTNHAGDVTGVYNNLQIANGAVSSTEIADATITAADLSSMGASFGQVMQWNGSAWVATTPPAGTETDPQVGSNSTNKIPKWDGSALVTGAINDESDRIGLGTINTGSRSTFRNKLTAFSTEDMAVYATDESGSGTTYATAALGYNTSGLIFSDAPIAHAGVYATGSYSSSTNTAAMYATTSSTGTSNYGLVAKSSGAGTTNYGIWAKASGASNNYALIVPTDGGKSGFNWSSPSALLGVKGNDTDDAFRVIGTDLLTNFVVDDNGKVGVGGDPGIFSSTFNVYGSAYIQDKLSINAPSALIYPLSVGGTDETVLIRGTDPYIQMEHDGEDVGYLRATGEDLQLALNAGNDDGKLVLRTNGVNRMYINDNGDIVMGNTTVAPKSGYKLSVDGKVVCEELLVQLSPWPDYVFNADYKLKPLAEVEQFIADNNHLPGVPAACDVEEEGLNVGEMQKIMMEKIEELTLYVIELQKQNESLKAEIEALKH